MFGKKQAKLTGELDRRSPRRWLIIIALALLPMLAYFTVQLSGAGLPQQPEPQATAAEQPARATPKKMTPEESAKFWAQVDKENKAINAKHQAQIDAFNASTEPAQAAPAEVQPVEAQPAEPAWKQFAGDYYYRFADKSEYSCDYSRCSVVRVKTMSPYGCPDGLYVEATVDAGGASVGRANAITAALPQGKEAIVKLTDTSGEGEKIVLTELHCLGE